MKYCTQTAVNKFILYCSFILFLIAFSITLIEKSFNHIFNAGLKVDMIYGLLV